jgi:AhpD family alkylhydroperoxidase
MKPRIDYRKATPAGMDTLSGINRYLDASGLDAPLRLLLEIRISQINGCAYCVNMHVQQARAAGETAQRLDCLCVWREVDFFEPRERAALAWAEALTLSARATPDEALYDALCTFFDEKAVVDLTLAIAGMNAWNRIGVAFRPTVREH